MSQFAAAEFKAKCLSILAQVKTTGEPVTITKRGRAIARVVAIPASDAGTFGSAKDEVTIHGDIVGPIDEEWEADR